MEPIALEERMACKTKEVHPAQDENRYKLHGDLLNESQACLRRRLRAVYSSNKQEDESSVSSDEFNALKEQCTSSNEALGVGNGCVTVGQRRKELVNIGQIRRFLVKLLSASIAKERETANQKLNLSIEINEMLNENAKLSNELAKLKLEQDKLMQQKLDLLDHLMRIRSDYNLASKKLAQLIKEK